MPFHALEMTVFSIVTAAFFPNNGQGTTGRGPDVNRYSDDSGDLSPRDGSPALGRRPGYHMLPPAIKEQTDGEARREQALTIGAKKAEMT